MTRGATDADAAAIARLHAARIGEGFLVTLGPAFLRRLYRRIIRSDRAFALVAEDSGAIVGFVAVAADTGRLYREFFVRDGIVAGFAALPAMVRRPRHVWETVRYGLGGEHDDLPPAEVLAVAVAGSAAGRGIGGDLVAHALEELDRRDVRAARVVTAAANDAARRMYRRCGFRPVARTEVHRGVPQEVLVWP